MAHHHHHHDAGDYGRAFAVGMVLNAAFVVFEAGFGFASGSLALLADAGHNLSDTLGLLIAWIGTVLAKRAPTERRTYGLRRSTILAALANAMLLLVAVGGIGWEAVRRMMHPEAPPGAAMIWVAVVGIGVNGFTAMLFFRGRHHDVNVRGAFLHLAADAAVSLGVVIAGIIVVRTGLRWIDPAVSLVIAVVILLSTWELLRESLDLALDAVPKGIEPASVYDYLASIAGVESVHDLHIWGLSTTESALTVHLVVPTGDFDDARIATISCELHERFGIEHATVQVERGTESGCPSGAACDAASSVNRSSSPI